jgi:hypothetical protein
MEIKVLIELEEVAKEVKGSAVKLLERLMRSSVGLV